MNKREIIDEIISHLCYTPLIRGYKLIRKERGIMDVTAVSQAIQGVGFPIVCVLGLSYFIYKIWGWLKDIADRLTATLIEVNTTNRELSETNKELSQTNRNLVEQLAQFQKDIPGIKEDIREIKRAVAI